MALIFTPSTDPDSAGLKHNEASRQGLSALFDQFDHIFSKALSHCHGVSYEHHTVRLLAVSIHELTEIPVLRQDNSLFASSSRDHLRVVGSGRHFRDGMDVIPGGS
jgi:hypothetical protein